MALVASEKAVSPGSVVASVAAVIAVVAVGLTVIAVGAAMAAVATVDSRLLDFFASTVECESLVFLDALPFEFDSIERVVSSSLSLDPTP